MTVSEPDADLPDAVLPPTAVQLAVCAAPPAAIVYVSLTAVPLLITAARFVTEGSSGAPLAAPPPLAPLGVGVSSLPPPTSAGLVGVTDTAGVLARPVPTHVVAVTLTV